MNSMPRPPRIHYPGAVYHAMARGVDGREVFIDDIDRTNFLEALKRLKSEVPFSILAYCLMGNHFHFAIQTESIPLSRIMHRLLTAYVIGFNSRHEREGHLFQARYKSVLCLDDRHLLNLIKYIHMNPVRAGLSASPRDWPWSSQREYKGEVHPHIVDTRLFSAAANEESSSHPDQFDPWPKAAPPLLLRKEETGPTPLDELAKSLVPNALSDLKSSSRVREITRKRALVAEAAVESGHSLQAITTWMGCTPQAIHRLVRRNRLIS